MKGRPRKLTAQMLTYWRKAAAEMTGLGLEAQNVIALRTMKLAAGGTAARTEVVRMIAEKASAGAEAVAILTMGGSGQKVIRRHRMHVRSNKRRLTR